MRLLALALALALQGQPNAPTSPPPWSGGRLYTSPTLHVGIRPAAFVTGDEVAVGATVQITTFALQ